MSSCPDHSLGLCHPLLQPADICVERRLHVVLTCTVHPKYWFLLGMLWAVLGTLCEGLLARRLPSTDHIPFLSSRSCYICARQCAGTHVEIKSW